MRITLNKISNKALYGKGSEEFHKQEEKHELTVIIVIIAVSLIGYIIYDLFGLDKFIN